MHMSRARNCKLLPRIPLSGIERWQTQISGLQEERDGKQQTGLASCMPKPLFWCLQGLCTLTVAVIDVLRYWH